MSKRDKEDIPMICSDCGNHYTMKFGSFRRNRNGIHRCKTCTMKALQKKLYGGSPEEKEAFLKKRNAAIKNGWSNQSEEKKKQISKDRTDMWENALERRNLLQKRMLKRWSDASDVERLQQGALMRKGRDKYWSDPLNRKYHSERARKKWYEQTPEEQKRIISAANKGSKDYLMNETPEQRMNRLNKMSVAMKNWWNSLSKEEFDAHMKKYQMGMRGYFDTLGNHEANKNELSFIELLKNHWIDFDYIYYSKIKHPDFDTLFPCNHIRPNVRVVAYHAWDFIIHCFDKDILVDVDGSIHDKDSASNEVHDRYGNKFVLYEYIQFKDSQRPYQTDGLDAYVIECYDDKMADHTMVRNVYSGERQSLKDFMLYLEWESLSDIDKKEFIKLTME